MPHGDWDKITQAYTDIYIHSRYAEHAQGIIDLIPYLRNDVELSDLTPFTSHCTFVFEHPDTNLTLDIWCEKAGEQFRVYLYDGQKVTDEIIVSNDDILSVVRQYAEKLRRAPAK